VTTSIFIVGMLSMALKKVENWLYWIVGDVISIPLYFYKGLVFTSLQFFIFLILAIMGYIEWKRKAMRQTSYA
jgi:nicotinamide mononucleotide transporter